jgi:hypothetical protein
MLVCLQGVIQGQLLCFLVSDVVEIGGIMSLVVLIVVLLLAFGGLPAWGLHSYGYGPSGVIGVLLIIVVVLILTGRL